MHHVARLHSCRGNTGLCPQGVTKYPSAKDKRFGLFRQNKLFKNAAEEIRALGLLSDTYWLVGQNMQPLQS